MTDKNISFFSSLLRGARVLAAYAVLILLLLLLLANWGLPHFAVLKPQLLLVLVFYWTLYRPTLMPPLVIFIAGLLLDILSAPIPIGTHAASYLLISGILKPRRRAMIGQSFMVVWAGFVVVILFDMAFKWLALTVLTDNNLDIVILLLNGFITVLAFPVLVIILVLVHRILPAGRGMVAA